MRGTLRRLLPVGLGLIAASIAAALVVAHLDATSRAQRARAWEQAGLQSFDWAVSGVLTHERQLASLVRLDPTRARLRWDTYASVVLTDPAADSAGFDVPVAAAGLTRFERSTGIHVYAEPHPGLIESPSADSDHVVQVAGAYRPGRPAAPLGLDLAANPLRAGLFALAARLHTQQASPPVQFLVAGSGRGTIIYTPVFAGRRLVGFVSGTYTAATLAQAVRVDTGGLAIRVLDGGTTLVGGHGTGPSRTSTLRVAGRVWTVTAWTTRLGTSSTPWLVLLVGLVITVAVLVTLRTALGRERYAMRLVDDHVAAERIHHAELERARAQLQAVIDNAPAAIALRDVDGRFELVNDTFAKWTGIARDALVGRAHKDTFASEFAQEVRASDARLIATGVPEQLELDLVDAAGSTRTYATVRYLVPTGDPARPQLGSFGIDVTDQRATARALADREELLAGVFDNAPIGQAILAIDGRVIRVNRALCELGGYSEEELLSTSFRAITDPRDVDIDIPLAHEAIAGIRHGYEIEKRYRHKLGHVILTRLSVSLVRGEDGNPRYFVAQLQDITARRALQQSVADSEARLRAFIENSPAAIVIRDLDGRYEYVNQIAADAIGRPAHQLIGRSSFLDHTPEISAEIRRKDALMKATGQTTAARATVANRDGVMRTYDVNRYPIRDTDGTVVGLGSFSVDVTEQLAAARALEDREQQLADAQAAAHLGSFEMNLQTGEIWWSQEMRRIIAVAPDFVPSLGAILDRTHPDDRELQSSSYWDARDGSFGEIEFRIVRDDGSVRHVHRRMFGRHAADGSLTHLWGTVQDITDRKLVEHALRDAREHAETILASMGEGYALTNGKEILAVNHTFCQLTGYAEDEVVGMRSPYAFWPADQRQLAIDRRAAVVAAGGGTFEVGMQRKNGSRFDAEITAHPARGRDGVLHGFVNTIRDVTEAKTREREHATLAQIARLVAEGASPDAVFERVSVGVLELFDGRSSALARFEPETGEVVFLRGDTDIGVDLTGRRFALDGTGVCSEVFRTGRVVQRRASEESDDPIDELKREIGADYSMAAPVIVKGELWGAVGVSFATPEAPPGAADRLTRFADLVGLAVANTEAWRALSLQAATDPMTGLANHRTFHARLRSEAQRARRYERHLSLVVIDLDHFKSVNDSFGHQIGDRVLVDVARLLMSEAREGEMVARLGGEEFAWLMPETDRHGAYLAAERVRRALETTVHRKVGRVTMSAGVCSSEFGRDAEQLVRYADRALYWAKDSGRNTTFLYTPEAHALLSQEGRDVRKVTTMASVRALARAIDSKDPTTRQHSDRVAELVEKIAIELGWTPRRAQLLRACGLLHDVGKIGIPDEILLKPGRLTADEYKQVKRHAELSALIASEVLEPEQVAWIRSHHERWDGVGYPDGLIADAIPDGGRIMAVADAYDCMTQTRSYQSARSVAEARLELVDQCGRQFAPDVVTAMLAIIDREQASVGA